MRHVMSQSAVWIVLTFVIGFALRAESQRLTRLKRHGDSTGMGIALLFMALGVYLLFRLVVDGSSLQRAFGL